MQAIDLQGSPLSYQQARLRLWQKKGVMHRTLCAVKMRGALEKERLKTSIECIIERHEILRTTFYTLPNMDIPVQVVGNHDLWSWSEISLEYLDSFHQLRVLDYLFIDLQKEIGDVQPVSLFQIWLLHLANDSNVLVVSLPALCADSSSNKLFITELARAYAQEALTDEILQYADVSAWQEGSLLEDENESERQYWHTIDLSNINSIHLPFERDENIIRKSVITDFSPKTILIPLSGDLIQRIETLVQQYQVSLSSWILACWQIFLWRLSDEPTCIIGVACDGRNAEELTNALGLYTRFVPICAHFERDCLFEQIVTSVHQDLQEAMARQVYFTWDEVEIPLDSDAVPSFFPISFEYECWPESIGDETLTFSLQHHWSCIEPFALKLSVVQIGERVQLEIQTDPQRIHQTQMDQIATAFGTLLAASEAQPQAFVSSLPLLTLDEQTSLVHQGYAPTCRLPFQVLHQLFEDRVHHHPNQIAVISTQEQLTYQQLNVQANRLAWMLQQRGIGSNMLIGVYMPRSAQMLVAILGILKAGGAYLPLDPTTPLERLSYQVQESEVLLLLTLRALPLQLPNWQGEMLCLEDLEPQLIHASTENLSIYGKEDDLAYVIYTSGSTGKPKGVMIRQGSVVNYTLALCELLESKPGWQYATVSTLAADLGNTAIFCALASGGCVQVLDYETITSSQAMATWMAQHPIDVLKIVPSHLSALLVGEQAKAVLPRRALVLGGEALPARLLQQVRELEASCQVYNHYGPTETTIGILVRPLGVLDPSQQELHTWQQIPLGRPILNAEVFVCDRWMQPVPIGVIGELYLGGAGLALGYKQAEQTAECFVPHPFSQQAGARLYRTGDLGCWDTDGQITFLGRRDRQIKLRGHRIELVEIEMVLRRHPQIRTGVVQIQYEEGGEPSLVSYVVARQPIVPEDLQAFLRQWLPESMIPTRFVFLDTLPLTTNGKVDWKKLPVPDAGADGEPIMVAGPRGPIEELLVAIWKEILGVPILGIHDNFFAIGGHSLMATRVVARMQTVLQITLPVQMLFEAPTIATLAQQVEQALHIHEGRVVPPLLAIKRPKEIPLSFAQQRLWFLDQLEPESTAYLAARAGHLRGKLNIRILEQCMYALVHRHESLRTTFEKRTDSPVQVIHPVGGLHLPVIDLQELKQEQREVVAQRLAKAEAQHPCNLATGPLLRIALIRVRRQEHVLLLTLHHIITDGWSNEILIREFTLLYQAFIKGKPSPLMLLPIQYADYALWQRQWLQGDVLEAQIAYWKRQLMKVPTLALPTDHPYTAVQTYHGAIQSIQFSSALSRDLVKLSRQENVTAFMFLLAAFQVLLMHYTGQSDFSIGTPIANRTRTEIEGIIGFFVNTLVLRANLAGNPTFLEVLKRVRNVCLEAYAHQDVPFEKLVEVLQPERDLSRSPLFQVSFHLEQATASSLQPPELTELTIESLWIDGASSDDDLRVMVTETEQGFACIAFYNTHLFEAETITRMLGQWQTLLEGILSTPQAPVGDLPLLTAQERDMLLVHWNATSTPYPHARGVHQLFEQQVHRTPEAVALVFEDAHLTYETLNQRANQLAYHLETIGVGPERTVGVCLNRSFELFIGLVGILKAGGAYLPLDPTFPTERLTFMLADTHAPVLVTTMSYLAHSHLDTSHITTICLDHRDWSAGASSHVENRPCTIQAENLAYVIYTSGSTGQPKGVQVSQQGLLNYLQWAIRYYRVAQGTGAPLHSSINFDLTVTSIFAPLLGGQMVVIVAEEQSIEPLGAILGDQRNFSLVKLTPAHLEGLTHYLAPEELLQGPQTMIIGGEALSYDHLTFWRTYAPGMRLINEYGPTETVVGCCIYEVPPQGCPDEGAVPIGRPISNMQMYVLTPRMQLTAVGIAGELYIGGRGLARGYVDRPEETAASFIAHPFSKQEGERLYRTGDRARYLPNGDLEYLGRIDQQIKIRGYRIELGEIEAVLGTHPAIQNAVVIVQEDRSDNAHLLAYVVPDLLQAGAISQEEQTPLIRERLKHWQRLYDEIYQQGTFQTIQTFNTVGWNSSYTNRPIAPEEMQSWLEDTLALIRAYHPERVWEIGCGTGLLLFPLAPECTHYYGTDFSVSVLEKVRQHLTLLEKEDAAPATVTLFPQQADDFSNFPERPVDTILINSVVQYFPNVDYLLRVLEGAVRLVAPGGRIIVGDIRSFPLLEAFHASVQLHRASESLTRQQLWQYVQQHVQHEEELTIDPTFFWHWAQNTQRVYRIEVRLKRGWHQNELTRFRYQVVLHVGEPRIAERIGLQHAKVENLNWSEQKLTRDLLQQKLIREQPERLRLRQVPNARVDQAIQTLCWLKGELGPETAGAWRTELDTQTGNGMEPEELYEHAERLGYQVTISWRQQEEDGSYTALLQRKDGEQWIDAEEELLSPTTYNESVGDWHRYANEPLQAEMERHLVPQIRQYLQEQLPAYMIPSNLVILKTLPLTPNGKVDRRRLSTLEEIEGKKKNEVYERPRTPIEELIGKIWCEVLGLTQSGIHDHFFESGGHSLLATQLVARIRAIVRVEVPLRVLFEAPTLAEFARRVERMVSANAGIEKVPMQVSERSGDTPLSFAQQRLWFLDQLYPESTLYLSPEVLHLQGELQVHVFEQSIQKLIHRHEVLRTTFAVHEGQPRQIIHSSFICPVPLVDLRGLKQQAREAAIQSLSIQEAHHPCDLAKGPLLRVSLLRLNTHAHMLLLTLHHIITDGWSNEVFVQELTTLYQAFATGQPSPLAPLPIQYADYALWQRQWLQGNIIQKHRAYWQRQLEGASPVKLPFDTLHTTEHEKLGARYSFVLSKDLSQQLMSLSRQEGVTLFMSLLAAFQAFLYRLTNQIDIVVGTDVANRTHVETEDLIGFFVNLLALRTEIQRTTNFRQLLHSVRTMVLDAYTHQELPFEMVIEQLGLKREEMQTPLIHVLFVLQNIPLRTWQIPGIEVESIVSASTPARFDLALFLHEETDSITGTVVYRRDLLREKTIATWMQRFEVLLKNIVTSPDTIIERVEFYTDEEKTRKARGKAEKRDMKKKSLKTTKAQGFEIE